MTKKPRKAQKTKKPRPAKASPAASGQPPLVQFANVTKRYGELTVLDRIALEARACSCYATDRVLHQTLFPAQSA